MDLAGVQNGGIIGFKYFGFGGLDQAEKGVVPFEGTKKGDNTNIYVNLTQGGHGAFKIHVRLDDPWKGKEIAVISVPDSENRNSSVFEAGVPDVEGLTGKHAIYLVAEGPEVQQPEQTQGRPQWGRRPQGPQRPKGLFDLHGVGFKKASERADIPIVPTVTITVDGQKLNVPSQPVMATNANGYTKCNRYQLYAPLKDDSKIVATVETVNGNKPDVSFHVSNVSEGRATVKAVYKGQEKVFLIN